MHVQAAEPRQIQDAPGQNLAVGGDGDQVGSQGAQFLHEIRAAGFLGLQDRDVMPQRQFLDRRGLQLEIPALGPVGLGNSRQQVQARRAEQCLEADAGEVSRAHKDNSEIGHELGKDYLNPRSRLAAEARGGLGLPGATAGPVTVRLPSEVEQRAQTNSCSSPVGSTSSRRSRTGWEILHFGQ